MPYVFAVLLTSNLLFVFLQFSSCVGAVCLCWSEKEGKQDLALTQSLHHLMLFLCRVKREDYLTTEQFLDKVAENLTHKLNQ